MAILIKGDKFKRVSHFFAVAVRKNQFKFQNNAFLMLAIQIWIIFYALAQQKKIFALLYWSNHLF